MVKKKGKGDRDRDREGRYRADQCTCAADLPTCPACVSWGEKRGLKRGLRVVSAADIDRRIADYEQRLEESRTNPAVLGSYAPYNMKRQIKRLTEKRQRYAT